MTQTTTTRTIHAFIAFTEGDRRICGAGHSEAEAWENARDTMLSQACDHMTAPEMRDYTRRFMQGISLAHCDVEAKSIDEIDAETTFRPVVYAVRGNDLAS